MSAVVRVHDAAGLTRALETARGGETIHLGSHTLAGSFLIETSVTLVGEDATLEGAEEQTPLIVDAPGAQVTLRGLRLLRGHSELGGALSFEQGTILQLENCVVAQSVARPWGGGGIYAAGRRLVLKDCVVAENVGDRGGGILLDQDCHLEARQTRFLLNAARWGGALALQRRSTAELIRCAFEKNAVTGPRAAGTLMAITGEDVGKPRAKLVVTPVPPEHMRDAFHLADGLEGTLQQGSSLSAARPHA